MPTTLQQRPQYPHSSLRKKKNYLQTLSIALGCFMIILGLSGILNPAFMGMHLSAMHSLVLTGGGILSIWAAIKSFRTAYLVNVGLSIFFALHAIAGFLLGEPGTPNVGYNAPDDLLLKIAPGFLELGMVDHIVHALLAIFFFTGAIWWKRHHLEKPYRDL